MKLNKTAIDLLLAEKQLSKSRLAEMGGVSPSTITKLLRGDQEARPATIGKMAEALKVPVTELIEKED